MPPDNEAIAEKDHLDRNAHRPGTATPQETQGHP
jgi:hypothetical protein